MQPRKAIISSTLVVDLIKQTHIFYSKKRYKLSQSSLRKSFRKLIIDKEAITGSTTVKIYSKHGTWKGMTYSVPYKIFDRKDRTMTCSYNWVDAY